MLDQIFDIAIQEPGACLACVVVDRARDRRGEARNGFARAAWEVLVSQMVIMIVTAGSRARGCGYTKYCISAS